MKQKTFILFLTLAGMALLAGCGGGGGSSPGADKNALHESETCIGCHEKDSIASNWTTPGTGKPVVNDWKASTHNSTTNGASCQDCHGSGYMHPTSCNKCHSIGIAAVNPILNPDAEDRCANCHAKVNPRGKSDGFNLLTYSDPKIPAGSTTAFTHFSTGKRANYVSTYYKQSCRKCHNPHDTDFGRVQRKQWAASGHGGTTTGARTSRDFKEFGSSRPAYDNFGSFCVRCHTTTGHLNYIKDGAFSDVNALPDSDLNKTQTNYPDYVSVNSSLGTWNPAYTYQDKSREATNCNACHEDERMASDSNEGNESSYSGRVRPVPQVVTYYSYESSVAQPDATPNLKQRYKLPSTISYANLPASNYIAQNGEKWGLQFNDFGLSNVCVACHSGREIGMMIKVASVGNPEINAVEAGRSLPLDFTKTNSAVSPHDRAAATNLNGISGFEFYKESSKYANPSTFLHDKLGLAPNYYGDPERRGNGPCIACHVANNSKSHLFLPADSNDNIISTTCNGCHYSHPIDIAAQKEGFAAALKALRFVGFHIDSYSTNAALASYDNRFQLTLNSVTKRPAVITYSGITVQANAATFGTSHSTAKWSIFGRWLMSPNPAGAGNGTTFVDYIIPSSGNPLNINATDAITAGAYTMGASFNYTLLNNDPGAFAHNPTYVKRLIYDSIDWLDNGQMDESVVNYLTTTLDSLAASSFAVNPALYEVSNIAPKSITLILNSGSGATTTFSKFTFTSDDLTKAITFLCGNTGVRP